MSWGLSGMVYSGGDVGGFFDDADPALLSRWHQVAAWLYPFFRSHCHHESNSRELYTIDGDHLQAAREAVIDRYILLPYWYTLARLANLTGAPLVRPLWWEFPEDRFLDVDDRAMLGPALFIVPFLSQIPSPLLVQFPAGSRWFAYRTLTEFTVPEQIIDYNGGRTAVFIRGGSIFPIRSRIGKSSGLMHLNPFTLIVAVDQSGNAEGEFYIDDGETSDFAAGGFIHKKIRFIGKKLISNDVPGSSGSVFREHYDVAIEQIRIAGMAQRPNRIIDGIGRELTFEVEDEVVVIRQLELAVRDDFELTLS
jgi:alpha 1,3-glucosidase